ncbi:MAG: DUF1631 domain-containing protein, partial [Gammaproteobacteria bacterium]|nr:DUF1631 domain-containing protein [Gammaproteobacteria bacterium]
HSELKNKVEAPRSLDPETGLTAPAGAGQQQSATQAESVTGGPGGGGGQGVSLGEEIFSNICNLLAVRRQNDPLYEMHPELNPNAPPVVMATRPALVTAIGDIQTALSREYKPVSALGGHDDPDFQVDTELLKQYRHNPFEDQKQLFDGVERRKIPAADLDTIELVGMLFEYVLNDTGLPNIVKALISYLHTPFLKVAVIDQSFL